MTPVQAPRDGLRNLDDTVDILLAASFAYGEERSALWDEDDEDSVMNDVLVEHGVRMASDPDAQAIVTDFSDYTEYLPSDLVRSLTLIRNLDESYVEHANRIHDLAQVYGSPRDKHNTQSSPAPAQLRSQLCSKLSQAITTRESTYAEASRLSDVVDRHYNRLSSIITKLKALPLPPSRDPSPVPPKTASPQTQRARGARKSDGEDALVPRITLRLDGARSVDRPKSFNHKQKHNRHRRVTVPGEVLPPPNLDSSSGSSESEWESDESSPVAPFFDNAAQRDRSKTHKSSKPFKMPKIKPPKPPRTPKHKTMIAPGPMGTNAHSAVAGISTSNALALLKPPPPDAKPGSEHAPWLRLTQWEMAKLRKRMKKNAVWVPSETMIRRELAELKRGPDYYHAAVARANATGIPLVDTANIAERVRDRSRKELLVEGEIGVKSLGMEEIQMSNRGMKLNEAKKQKREMLQRELALQQATEGGLITTGSPILPSESTPSLSPTAKPKEPARSHKRKRESSPTDVGGTTQSGPEKKRKTSVPLPSSLNTPLTIKVPLAAEGPSASTTPALRAGSPGNKKTPKTPKTPNGPSVRLRHGSASSKSNKPPPRPRSRGASAPVEEKTTAGKDRPRRSSAVNVTPTVEPTAGARAAGRRGKRPVPGRLTTGSGEGGAAVIVGKRSAAPKKKASNKKAKDEGMVLEERGAEFDEENLPIDPDEPRYCLCGDVSWGTMIMCENNECEREWFHLDCIGLSEIPGRTTKWYCPDCRKKLGIGEKSQSSAKSRRR